MKIRHFVLILLAAFLCMMALEFVFGFHPVPMGVDRWCARKEWMPTDRYNALPCTCERRTGERRENNRRYSLWRSACFTHDLSRAGRAIQGGVACRNRTDRRTTDRRSPEGEEQSE